VKNKIALLNIGAYHSADARSFGSLLALPSSRVSVGWAQDVLFPDAEAGRRIVVCMRSASYWGLEQGRKYEGIPVAALRIAAREVGPLIPGTSAFTRVQLRSPGRRAPPTGIGIRKRLYPSVLDFVAEKRSEQDMRRVLSLVASMSY
jgi:hypothetical protein